MNAAFRYANPKDLAFVYDAWLDSYKNSHAAGPIPMDEYKECMTRWVTRLLARSRTKVLVATSANDKDLLYGFVVAESDDKRGWVVHYVYVKNAFRRLGYGTRLLKAVGIDPSEPFTYTHKTPVAKKMEDHWSGARFNPFPARFPPSLE